MKQYNLFYNEIFIGKIEVKVHSLPNTYGKLQLNSLNKNDKLCQHIWGYIQYCMEIDKLYQENKEDEIDFDEQEKYIDLIDSEDWYLQDEKGNKDSILIPVFGTDNYVNCQYF